MALNRLKTATLLAGLAGAFAAPGAAQAQFFFDTWGGRFDVPLDGPYAGRHERGFRDAAPLDRAEVRSILTRRGYRVEPSIARNSDVYVVDAIDPAGRRLRLIVDAYDATILRRLEATSPRRLSREEDEDRWLDGEGPAIPPGSIPGGAGAPRAEPHVIPGVGPAPRAKPAPKKPTTARVEPRAPAPKATTAPEPEPAPSPATPPATAPAPAAPGPGAETPAPKQEAAKPDARSEAPKAEAKPEAKAEAKPEAKAEAKPEAKAEAKPEPKAEAKAETKPPQAHAESQAKPAENGPRVIPLYKKPAADKPAEGAP